MHRKSQRVIEHPKNTDAFGTAIAVLCFIAQIAGRKVLKDGRNAVPWMSFRQIAFLPTIFKALGIGILIVYTSVCLAEPTIEVRYPPHYQGPDLIGLNQGSSFYIVVEKIYVEQPWYKRFIGPTFLDTGKKFVLYRKDNLKHPVFEVPFDSIDKHLQPFLEQGLTDPSFVSWKMEGEQNHFRRPINILGLKSITVDPTAAQPIANVEVLLDYAQNPDRPSGERVRVKAVLDAESIEKRSIIVPDSITQPSKPTLAVQIRSGHRADVLAYGESIRKVPSAQEYKLIKEAYADLAKDSKGKQVNPVLIRNNITAEGEQVVVQERIHLGVRHTVESGKLRVKSLVKDDGKGYVVHIQPIDGPVIQLGKEIFGENAISAADWVKINKEPVIHKVGEIPDGNGGQRIISSILFLLEPGHLRILDLNVHPDFWDSDVGTQTLKPALDLLRPGGRNELKVVLPDPFISPSGKLVDSYGFFLKMGFVDDPDSVEKDLHAPRGVMPKTAPRAMVYKQVSDEEARLHREEYERRLTLIDHYLRLQNPNREPFERSNAKEALMRLLGEQTLRQLTHKNGPYFTDAQILKATAAHLGIQQPPKPVDDDNEDNTEKKPQMAYAGVGSSVPDDPKDELDAHEDKNPQASELDTLKTNLLILEKSRDIVDRSNAREELIRQIGEDTLNGLLGKKDNNSYFEFEEVARVTRIIVEEREAPQKKTSDSDGNFSVLDRGTNDIRDLLPSYVIPNRLHLSNAPSDLPVLSSNTRPGIEEEIIVITRSKGGKARPVSARMRLTNDGFEIQMRDADPIMTRHSLWIPYLWTLESLARADIVKVRKTNKSSNVRIVKIVVDLSNPTPSLHFLVQKEGKNKFILVDASSLSKSDVKKPKQKAEQKKQQKNKKALPSEPPEEPFIQQLEQGYAIWREIRELDPTRYGGDMGSLLHYLRESDLVRKHGLTHAQFLKLAARLSKNPQFKLDLDPQNIDAKRLKFIVSLNCSPSRFCDCVMENLRR